MRFWKLFAVLVLLVPLSVYAVNLAWDASTSPEVTGYKIYHGTSSGVYSTNVDVGNVLTATIPDGDLAPGTNYIAATAYAPGAESGYSNEVTYTVAQAPDTEPPTTPGTPGVSTISSTQLNLTWTASTDNVGVTGYRVERCTGASCNTGFSEIAQPSTNSYSNTGLTASTTYGYRIRASDAAGNLSAYSGIGYGTTANPSSAIVAWGFPEGTGTTSADQSGNSHTLTLQGGTTWTTSGHTGNAISFSGTGQFATTPHVADLTLGNTGTLEAWIYLTAVNRWHGIISKGTANSNASHNYAIEIQNNNLPICVLGTGSASNTVSGGSALTVNTWYHVACTWDGTTMRLYVNGTQVATSAQTLTPVGNTTQLSLGQFGNGFDRMQGRIDDVRIYNIALSATQIQSDRDTPVGSGTPPGQLVITNVISNPIP